MSQPTVGILAPLIAQADKTSEFEAFLLKGHEAVVAEPGTLQWVAVKDTDPAPAPVYAIFDTFADEAGRQAHINGEIPKALGSQKDHLLAKPPQITPVKVLASKVKSVSKVEKGLRVLIKPKPEKVDAVRAFLVNALPLVEKEEKTPLWYAIEFPPEAQLFGIADMFESEAGRDLHLAGEVAKALFASADELLLEAPEVVKFDVLASKV